MELQNQETDRSDETSQCLVFPVVYIALKAKVSLSDSSRTEPRKEQGDSGLIAFVLLRELVLQVFHFSLHHGSIDGGETSQKHSGDDQIAARDGKTQADNETSEIKGIAR